MINCHSGKQQIFHLPLFEGDPSTICQKNVTTGVLGNEHHLIIRYAI